MTRAVIPANAGIQGHVVRHSVGLTLFFCPGAHHAVGGAEMFRDAVYDFYAYHAAPLDECACCGYLLKGHGRRGNCPECGEAFSEVDCCVSQGNPVDGRLPQLSEFLGAGIVIAAGFFLIGNLILATIFLIVGCIVASPVVRWRFVGADRIAFRSDGIVEYQECRRVRQTRWSDVASVRVTFNGEVLVRSRGRLFPRSVFRGSRDAAEALCSQIRELRRASIED